MTQTKSIDSTPEEEASRTAAKDIDNNQAAVETNGTKEDTVLMSKDNEISGEDDTVEDSGTATTPTSEAAA